MTGFTQLPPPHHYETVEGEPVVGWWAPDSGDQPVYAVIMVEGRMWASVQEYRLRQFKMAKGPMSAPAVDESAQGRECDHSSDRGMENMERAWSSAGLQVWRCRLCGWVDTDTPVTPDTNTRARCDHEDSISAVDISALEDPPGSRFIRQCRRCHWSEEVTVPPGPAPEGLGDWP